MYTNYIKTKERKRPKHTLLTLDLLDVTFGRIVVVLPYFDTTLANLFEFHKHSLDANFECLTTLFNNEIIFLPFETKLSPFITDF